MTKQTTRTLLLAAGVCIMTTSLQPRQAYGWGEAAVVAAIKALQQFTGKQMDKVGENITNSLNDMTNPHSVSSMIRDAATQQANYAKGKSPHKVGLPMRRTPLWRPSSGDNKKQASVMNT